MLLALTGNYYSLEKAKGEEATLSWRCKHRYPLLVVHIGTSCHARCMGCGVEGPVRASLPEAMRALRGASDGILKPTIPPVAGRL